MTTLATGTAPGVSEKWAIELSKYDINFERQSTIKLQILVDFMAEWTELGAALEKEQQQQQS
jgi:hypothetical protein